MKKYYIKRNISKCLVGLFGKSLVKICQKVFNVTIFYHRDCCRKQARCVKCGRYICEGCNATGFKGLYGYCMECGGYSKDTILPIKPLFKPRVIIPFKKSCNENQWVK